MSFILDALKKSESDRQRQAGPALFEVRIAAPRSRFPLWSLVVAALLGLNVLVLGGWLIVRAARTQALATSATPAAVTAVSTAAAPRPSPAAVAAAAPAAPATPATAAAAPAPRATATPRARPAPAGPRDPEVAALDPAPDPAAAAERADDEPAVDSGALAPHARSDAGGSVRTGPTGLPTRDELHSTAVASLPELRLDLHVYDADPRKRFVLLNMHRLHEGDSIPEGVRVDRITEEGAELDYQGQHFLLRHE